MQNPERSSGSSTDMTVRWSAATLTALMGDPAVSSWLKQAIPDLANRDPVDALNDVELLCALMRSRCDVIVRAARAQAQTWENSTDGP